MSSTSLIDFLRKLDYDKPEQLRADRLSIICNDRHLRRLIEHLTKTIQKERHFVSTVELTRFDQLRSDGRALLDLEHRRMWLEKKRKPSSATRIKGDGDDQDVREEKRRRLELARNRLRSLKDEEQRLRTFRANVERDCTTDQSIPKLKSDLKDAQMQTLGMDPKISVMADKLRKHISDVRLTNSTALSSTFLAASGINRCASSVRNAMTQSLSIYQSIQDDKTRLFAVDSDDDHDRMQEEIDRLRDAIRLAYLELLDEERKTADVNARLKRLGELDRRQFDGDELSETNLKSRLEAEELSTRELLEQIKASENSMSQLAAMQADFRVAQVLYDVEIHPMLNLARFVLSKSQAISTGLKHQSERLSILLALLSQEQSQIRSTGHQPLSDMHRLLQNRLDWFKNFKRQLERIRVEKRMLTTTSATSAKSRCGIAFSLNDEGHADDISRNQVPRLISEMFAMNKNVIGLRHEVSTHSVPLSANIEQCRQNIRAQELTLKTYVDAVDALNRGSSDNSES